MKRNWPKAFWALVLAGMAVLASCSKADDAPPPSNPQNQNPNTPPTGGGDGETPPAFSNAVPCENGLAGPYPCSGFDLVGRFSLEQLGGAAANDIWGWADPQSGTEYALVGLDNGTAFISLEDPEAPLLLGTLPTETTASIWRDVKVYANHAYIVSEAGGHGMQVFDLQQLRSVANPPVTFSPTAVYTGFGNAHNIVINENTGFAYAVGTGTFQGGPHFIDLSSPASPQAAGGYAASGYSHDAQVVTYSGPDTDYTGREIYIGANENEVTLIDVTDKANPTRISGLNYPNLGYTHQGWFTEDQRYFLLGDELDEIQFGLPSRTLVFDLADLDNPVLSFTYNGPTAAIDHNGYVQGDRFYLANYTAGLRVVDLSGIGGQALTESGYFDTFPASNATEFDGVWSIYPFLESGLILINDISNGFFVVRPSP
ncbi:choice-of-anchor B family protein [Robiginitalea sediminis]|uniref:choice-of-anchor B family protein n=1 Tax=Robiginitalea sediminis TaxID=1982593 RepID=UPI000B4B5BDE|nr:choice-of-anchor B family protein [Robiginitalea sediminis]